MLRSQSGVQTATDASGNVTGLIGPNGIVRLGTAFGNTLGVIGDSRDDSAYAGSAVGGTPAFFSCSYRSLKWAMGLSGQPFRRVADFSRSGSGMGTVPIVAAVHPTFPEQLASVLVALPAYCWIRVPINDLINGSTAAVVWPLFKTLVDTVLAAGIRVELVGSTVTDSSKGGYVAAVQNEVIKLNDLVRAEYGSKGALGVVFHDTCMVAMQQGVTTYAGVTNAYNDAVHFQNVGAYLEGSMIVQSWLTRFKPLPLLGRHCGDAFRNVPADFNSVGAPLSNSANYLSNGMFDLGTPVSGVAQGWSIVASSNCTATASIVAAPAWDGNTDGKGQQLAITATAAGAFIQLESPNMFGDIKLLKKYLAAALITVAPGAVNLKNARMELQVSSNITYQDTWGFLNAGDDAIPAMNTNGYSELALCELDLALRPDLAASGGGQYFRIRFVVSFGTAGSGSATVTFSRATNRVVN